MKSTLITTTMILYIFLTGVLINLALMLLLHWLFDECEVSNKAYWIITALMVMLSVIPWVSVLFVFLSMQLYSLTKKPM